MQFGLLAGLLANISQCFAEYQADTVLDSLALDQCLEHAVEWDCFRMAAWQELLSRIDLATCLSAWM